MLSKFTSFNYNEVFGWQGCPALTCTKYLANIFRMLEKLKNTKLYFYDKYTEQIHCTNFLHSCGARTPLFQLHNIPTFQRTDDLSQIKKIIILV